MVAISEKPTKIAVFNQLSLNGAGVGDDSDENANLLSIVQKQIEGGENYEIETGISSFNISDLETRLSDASFFIMTDMESGNPNDDSFLPDSAVATLKAFVEGGGVMVMTGTGGSYDTDFLNRVFSWDLGTTYSSSWALNAAASTGTPFEGGPATLASANATDSISRGTVENFTAIYGDDANATVAVIEVGAGTVIFQGFDFYGAGFAVDYGEGTHVDGYQNSNDWVTEVLPRSLKYATAIAEENNSTELVSGDDSGSVEVAAIGGANSLTLSFEDFGLEGVGELSAYRLEEDGSKTQLASFFGLDGRSLSSEYGSSFSIETESLSAGEKIQFELVTGGSVRTATVEMQDERTAVLDFGDNTRLMVALSDEAAAPNLLREDATTLDLTGYDSSDVTLNFSVYREASYNSTVGFYRTDSAEGGIKDAMTGEMLVPGDDGYKDAALSRQLDLQLSAENGEVATFSSTIEGGNFLGMFLIADGSDAASGELLFSNMGMNSGNDHVKMLGDNVFGFEDMVGLGDRDYNDLVVKVEVG